MAGEMTKLEEVARALADTRAMGVVFASEDSEAWADLPDELKADAPEARAEFLEMAAWAIKAMKHPTEAMIDAGLAAMIESGHVVGDVSDGDRDAARLVYTAMLRKALEEG